MENRRVKAKCLFCDATVEGNQELMKGSWDSYDDFEPVWQWGREDTAISGWLWHKFGRFNKCQDFYLCPRHNTAAHFISAQAWAGKQLALGKYIDFTQALCPVICTPPTTRTF